MRERPMWWMVVVAVVALGACSGEAARGEECGDPGAEEGECEEGTICAKPSDSSENLVCIDTCNDDADCSGGDSCNGVEGSSVKGCRDKAIK